MSCSLHPKEPFVTILHFVTFPFSLLFYSKASCKFKKRLWTKCQIQVPKTKPIYQTFLGRANVHRAPSGKVKGNRRQRVQERSHCSRICINFLPYNFVYIDRKISKRDLVVVVLLKAPYVSDTNPCTTSSMKPLLELTWIEILLFPGGGYLCTLYLLLL